MILSTSHEFIFVHVPKTAGTAMTAALELHAVTGTRTLFRRALRWLPLREAPGRAYFRKHETAAAIEAKLGPEVYRRFFSFSVVRNPFDHAVSHYEYLKEFRNPKKAAEFAAMSFSEYLYWRMTARGPFVPWFSILPDQTHFLLDAAGSIAVNRVLHFETLAEEWPRLMVDLGLGGADLPWINKTRAKSDKRPVADYYDDDTVRTVQQLYTRDFNLFGYPRDLRSDPSARRPDAAPNLLIAEQRAVDDIEA